MYISINYPGPYYSIIDYRLSIFSKETLKKIEYKRI